MKGFSCGIIRGEARTKQTRPYRTTGAASADRRPGQNSPPEPEVASRRPRRPRKGPRTRERSGVSSQRQKTPKINNSPITGFKTHLQNQSASSVICPPAVHACTNGPQLVPSWWHPAWLPRSPLVPACQGSSARRPTWPVPLTRTYCLTGHSPEVRNGSLMIPHQRFLLWAQRLAQWVGHSTANPKLL